MKGYLTVFLSLSLGVLAGFVLLLTGNAVRNAGKVRLEGAVDIAMNAALGEFHTGLYERYGLLYIDTSYRKGPPSLGKLEQRLFYYIDKNTGERPRAHQPWENIALKKASVLSVQTAAQGKGNSMKYQGALYVEDKGIEREEAKVKRFLPEAERLAGLDGISEWAALQAYLEAAELPLILNEKGLWEEVPLDNPADGVYGLLGSDILYLAGFPVEQIGAGRIQKKAYPSGRELQNECGSEQRQADDELFLAYLFEKMGNYGREREGSFLKYQLEYIAAGESSDYENLQAVAETLLKWRFADNISCALKDGGLYGEAEAISQSLPAVRLKPELGTPVAKSLLYACAYLESVGDVRRLFSGGRVPLRKDRLALGMEAVLSQAVSETGTERSDGLNYEQYLGCMLLLLQEDQRNLRAMDIVEMDIRYLFGNPFFALDFCVERCKAEVIAGGSFSDTYKLVRSYGYY